MTKRKKAPLVDALALFAVWCEAAAEWRRLGSGAAEARCRAARRDYYLVATGHEPPRIKTTELAA